jgi:hypothetical protein
MALIKIDLPSDSAERLTHLDHVDNYTSGDCADVYDGAGSEWKYIVATYVDNEPVFWGTNSEHAAYNIVARPPKAE